MLKPATWRIGACIQRSTIALDLETTVSPEKLRGRREVGCNAELLIDAF